MTPAKRIFILATLFAAFVPGLAQAAVSVYFIPHQDDEMYMAGSIARDVKQGKDVYVVAVTDGRASSVLKYLEKNERKISQKISSTVSSSAPFDITTSSFVYARDREFLRSVTTLGVPRDHIYFGASLAPHEGGQAADGHLSIIGARRLIESFYNRLGVGTYTTIYPVAHQHSDHHNLGLGLLRSLIKGKKQFFYESAGSGGTARELTSDEITTKYQALRQYFVWDPAKGRLAIASQSVENRLEFWLHHPFEYVTSTYGHRLY